MKRKLIKEFEDYSKRSRFLRDDGIGDCGEEGSYCDEYVAYLEELAYTTKLVDINLHDFGYSCGDDCCYNYGTKVTVNGNEMPYYNDDVRTILEQVLTHLGYEVEITNTEYYE